jgi:hypothetical protein
MADKDIEIHWENVDEFERLLDLMENAARRKARGLLEDLALRAKLRLMLNVPKGETLYLVRHVASSEVRYQAGGRSEGNVPGGGEYVAVVGIKRGSSMHPLYVHRGTGIYDTRPGASKLPIRPRADRAYQVYIIAPDSMGAGRFKGKRKVGHNRRATMTFQKRGEARTFRRSVKGQRPNPFLYTTWREMELYASQRMLTLGGEIVHPFR